MKKLILVALAVLPLTACATLSQPVTPETQAKVDNAAQIACQAVTAAHTVWLATPYAKDPEKAKIELQVYAPIEVICRPPYTVDVATLADKAIQATIVIMQMSNSPAT